MLSKPPTPRAPRSAMAATAAASARPCAPSPLPVQDPVQGSAARRRGAGGFTLIEVVIAGSLVSVLTLLIIQSLADLAKAQAFTQSQSRIAAVADRAMRGLVNDVTYSVRMFTDGADGDAYLAAMAYPAVAVVPDSRLPRLTQRGYFEADPPDRLETGNLLFLARNEQPVLAAIGDAVPPQEVRVDTLGFVIYYLYRNDSGDIDIGRWGSAPLARHNDIVAVEAGAQRQQVLAQLLASGVRYAWNTTQPAEDALFEITETFTLRALAVTDKIPGEAAQARPSILGKRSVSVAPNGKLNKLTVPAYASATPGGFPGGFEIKIDGPSTGKLVLLRLVLRGGEGEGVQESFAEGLRLVSCRDG